MGNVLGHTKKSSRATITDMDRAVLSLKAQRKKLEDQSKLLERRMEHNVEVARELVAAQKRDRALLALKKKKLNEHQLAQIQAWLLNVEDMLSSMELGKQQQRVFAALKDGNAALRAAQQELSIDDIQNLMDETAEAKEYQDRVHNVLSQQLDESDNEAVAAELADLEAAEERKELEQLPAVPTTPELEELPAVPMTQVAAGPQAAQQQPQQERQLEQPLAAS